MPPAPSAIPKSAAVTPKNLLDNPCTTMITLAMLARRIISVAPVSETLTPFPRYSYGFFCTSEKLNSYKINHFQALFVKHPGYGVPLRHLPVLRPSALSPLFDFLSLCFQNLTNPFSHNPFPLTSIQNPGGVAGVTLRSRAFAKALQAGTVSASTVISPADRKGELRQMRNARNFASRLMLYIAIQCTETPFRERFGATMPTPVD